MRSDHEFFETYWDDDELVVDALCDRCHQRKQVAWVEDPFAADIHDDHTLMWMCAECHYESSMDI